MDVKIPPSGGHCYMELVEKDESGKTTVARMQASMWVNDARRELPKFQRTTGVPFATGLKVLVKAKLIYHEVYGLSLNIIAIDGTYTLGDIAKKRQELINRLKQEGIYDLNRGLNLPQPVYNIAVISSQTAAGWGDFQDQLLHNPNGFPFRCQLFTALMQGEKAPESIISALDEIKSTASHFDIVVIIRGGGAQSHLQDLETYDLARAVATFPIPVITGIGHHKDENVLDEVAFAHFKTPTAVAEYLVALRVALLDAVEKLQEKLFLLLQEEYQRSQQLLTNLALRMPALLSSKIGDEKQNLEHLKGYFRQVLMHSIQTHSKTLNESTTLLFPSIRYKLMHYREQLNSQQVLLQQLVRGNLSNQWTELKNTEKLVTLLHPKKTLQRGFSIVKSKGKAVKSVNSLLNGEKVELIFADGTVQAEVKKQ